jgi:hypothetical protein
MTERSRGWLPSLQSASPNYIGGLTAGEIALTLSGLRALGSKADYLHQTVLSRCSGIHDGYLWDLQERVAELIERKLAKLSNRCNLHLICIGPVTTIDMRSPAWANFVAAPKNGCTS